MSGRRSRGRRAPAVALILATALLLCGCAGDLQATDAPQCDGKSNREAAIRRGLDWLLAQQAEDGGWHSKTYGQMRCGAGNTALVLYALSCLEESVRRDADEAIERAIRFLLSNLDETGFIRGPDGCGDYPNYATALTLAALGRLGTEDHVEQRKRLQSYLLQSQHAATKQEPPLPGVGGWNHTGGRQSDRQAPGDEDLSVTSFALEALSCNGDLNDSTRAAALRFLGKCQNYGDGPSDDGGFCFKAVPDDLLNKAGWHEVDGKPFRGKSYASATADGLVALSVCGLAADDPRVAAATHWLRSHEAVDHVPGVPAEPAEVQMRDALRYYYFAALARAAESAPQAASARHRAAIVATLIDEQRPDGSWQNPCPLMRENDPLVATPLALQALAILGTTAPAGAGQ